MAGQTKLTDKDREKQWRALHRTLTRATEQLKSVRPGELPAVLAKELDEIFERQYGPKAGPIYWQRLGRDLRRATDRMKQKPDEVPPDIRSVMRRVGKVFDSPYPSLIELHPAQVRLPSFQQVRLALVGCGGTGSWVAPQLARLARLIGEEHGVPVSAVFVDFDTVEPANLVRQNFCEAELGLYKAMALAQRYSAAYGVEVTGLTKALKPEEFITTYMSAGQGALNVIVGCVDSPESRVDIARTLDGHQGRGNWTWWLDCGNSLDRGQVYLGSAAKLEHLDSAFPLPGVCLALPSPALTDPKLLVPEAVPAGPADSCAAIAQESQQSRSINQMLAAIAATYLFRLFHGSLEYFATYVNAVTGEMCSTPITLANVALACGADLARLAKPVAADAVDFYDDIEVEEAPDDDDH